MNTSTRVMRSTTFAAICGLTLAAGMAGVPAVLELAPAATAQAQEQAPTIDFKATGSINIHKRAGTAGEAHDTGNENQKAPGNPLEKAGFTVWKVNVPFSNTAEVQAAQKLTTAEAADKLGERQGDEKLTDSNGVATFDNLPVGVYYVKETTVPQGHVPGAPFLVFVPMTNPDTLTGWNYHVHVYPKNSENKAEKAVTDADQNVGDVITYAITSDLPKPVAGGMISKYEVVDTLDPRVEVTPDDISVAFNDGTEISRDNYTATVENNVAKVVFNEQGLKLLTDNVDKRLVTTIKAKVKEIGDGSSEIKNQATVISNNGAGSGDTTVPTNEVKTHYGKLKVLKHDKDGAPLKDATFELYRCENQATLGGKISINGTDTWTTGADGTLLIDGLHVTDVENNDKLIGKKYCLKETKAPAGYELLPAPIEFTFTREDIAATGEDDAVTLTKKVENVKSVTPQLPLTGGAGIGLIVGLGALIIGAGAWYAKRNTNRG
ncbi:SpaH/EbpB family LPXTG-anchored major pilin [Corynebacterium diphtheriae]|nr:SpaH/EbpB family LPXTG-anchored major pilin [Corynebacterium diphtheriae]CAB1024240.1 SpaH/EbpB family LPXTG-anchored major pilin [Corynebacterium diphtheriae]